MNDRLFVDTNVLIRLFEDDGAVIALTDNRVIYISVVTEMEMQCKLHQTVEQANLIREMLDDCIIVGLSDSVKKRAIKICRETRLKLLDAIVAASAVELALPLLTADDKMGSVKQTTVLVLPPRF